MKATFEEIINQETPVLVDFHATWCGPCKAMAPVLKQLADKYKDKVRIIKIDVDKNTALAAKVGVMGVPTFILYKNGKVQWKDAGAKSIKDLSDVIDAAQ